MEQSDTPSPRLLCEECSRRQGLDTAAQEPAFAQCAICGNHDDCYSDPPPVAATVETKTLNTRPPAFRDPERARALEREKKRRTPRQTRSTTISVKFTRENLRRIDLVVVDVRTATGRGRRVTRHDVVNLVLERAAFFGAYEAVVDELTGAKKKKRLEENQHE